MTRARDLWLEFVDPEVRLCGLCGNTGLITHTSISCAGVLAYVENKPCICPNGRAIKKEERQ